MTITSADTDSLYFQHTLKNSFTCVSPGLHTGVKVAMCVTPASANSGITFVRHDTESSHSEIQASWRNVKDTRLSTTIANSRGVHVSSVEHLMAALYANGIDNARVIVDGPEVPIMDGSAAPFVKLIKNAGKVKQNNERRAIIIKQAISESSDKKFASFTPSPIQCIEVNIEYDSTPIGKQSFTSALDQEIFNTEIAKARTFSFKEQIATLHKLGLAQGGSLENTVLIDKNKIINKNGLRYDNEFIRHKMIDSIGDLALLGARFVGRFTGVCNDHQLNIALIQKLMADEHAWKFTTLRDAHKYWNGLMHHPYHEIVPKQMKVNKLLTVF